MNIKKGLRRILTVILSLITVHYLLIYTFSGFIFWNIDYISDAKVINLSNGQEIELIDFSQKYFEKKKELYDYSQYYFKSLGFRVHPYKQYFLNYDNHKFKNNEIYEIDSIKYQIKLPNCLKYLFTQIWQLLLIPLFWLIIWGLYLLIETIVIWIINGFKNN